MVLAIYLGLLTSCSSYLPSTPSNTWENQTQDPIPSELGNNLEISIIDENNREIADIDFAIVSNNNPNIRYTNDESETHVAERDIGKIIFSHLAIGTYQLVIDSPNYQIVRIQKNTNDQWQDITSDQLLPCTDPGTVAYFVTVRSI